MFINYFILYFLLFGDDIRDTLGNIRSIRTNHRKKRLQRDMKNDHFFQLYMGVKSNTTKIKTHVICNSFLFLSFSPWWTLHDNLWPKHVAFILTNTSKWTIEHIRPNFSKYFSSCRLLLYLKYLSPLGNTM